MKERTGAQALRYIQRWDKKGYSRDIRLGNEIPEAKATPTGNEQLDQLLGGGWCPGLNLIYGQDGAGKSRLAGESVIAAAKRGQICVWIGTDELQVDGEPMPPSLQFISDHLTAEEQQFVVYKSAADMMATPDALNYITRTFMSNLPEPPMIVIDPVSGVKASEEDLAKYSHLDVQDEEVVQEDIDMFHEQPIRDSHDRQRVRETTELAKFLFFLHHRAARNGSPVLVVAQSGDPRDRTAGSTYHSALEMTMDNTGAPQLGVLRHLPRIAVFVEDITTEAFDKETGLPIPQDVREVAITPVKANVMGARPLMSIEDLFEVTQTPIRDTKQNRGTQIRYIQSLDELGGEK